MMKKPVLKIDKLSKSFGAIKANDNLNLNLFKNEIHALIGPNGSGKSTVLDALTFGLFGRAFRKVNKMALINSINRKATVVEVEFSIGRRQYKVMRAIKPNKFEIYLNGSLIHQDSNVRDYQALLEQQILKLNYKSFTQVVVLGNSSFIPFMQLNTYERRGIIEDILDIQIFSVMNDVLKSRYVSLRHELHEIKTNINHLSENTKSYQLIKSVLNNNSKGVYQGKIFVNSKAQKTDGYQLSKALLLNENTEFNGKPELEIYADDVKCSHGSTSGNLDENSIFYLMSRGLNYDQAKKLLIDGFINDVIEKITNIEIQKYLNEAIN